MEQQDTSPRFVAKMVETLSLKKVSRHPIIVLRLFHRIRVLRELLESARYLSKDLSFGGTGTNFWRWPLLTLPAAVYNRRLFQECPVAEQHIGK